MFSSTINKETDPEKHYRELVMLFTPWRNEETDLLSSFSSYFERYLVLKDVIEEQKKNSMLFVQIPLMILRNS